MAVNISTKPGAIPKPLSYAVIVSNDLSSIIKSAVVQSIREHKVVECIQACVAIHGMREYKSELSDVQELCRYLESKGLDVSAARISRSDKSANDPVSSMFSFNPPQTKAYYKGLPNV